MTAPMTIITPRTPTRAALAAMSCSPSCDACEFCHEEVLSSRAGIFAYTCKHPKGKSDELDELDASPEWCPLREANADVKPPSERSANE